MTLKIRGHHLLCLQGFQGEGYSPDFIANFWDLLKRLESDPGLQFEITADTDATCEPCPHRDGINCAKDVGADKRMRDSDARVLKKIDLNVGHIQNAKALLDFVNGKLKSKQSVADVCGPCSWQSRCLWYQSRTE